MNPSWSAQAAVGSQRRKQTFRENDHRARRALRQQRLKEKGIDQESRESIELRVRERITKETEACDLLFSLFASALFNLRRASICEPYPDDFMKNETKEYSMVETYTNALPDIKHFVDQESALSNLPLPILKLVAWVVDTEPTDGIIVERVSLDQYKSETSGIDAKQSKFSDPNYIFKINYTEDNPTSSAWQRASEKYGVTIGFHGSGFENFHSIVRNGLDSSYGKETSLYGEGIYLSEDRDVAFSFLKCGRNYYNNSIFGKHVGCIVCGEVIKHPKHVRISSEKDSSGISINDDEAKLPKGYMVVENNDYVRVKYILVYENFLGHHKKKTNFCQLAALFYIILLVGLYLMRSTTVSHYYSRFGPVW